MSKVAGKGGRTPGAGRKPNAVKLMQVKFAAPFFGEARQATIWKSMLASKDEKVVLDAAKYLSDRIYGKAPQALELSGELAVMKRVISDL